MRDEMKGAERSRRDRMARHMILKIPRVEQSTYNLHI